MIQPPFHDEFKPGRLSSHASSERVQLVRDTTPPLGQTRRGPLKVRQLGGDSPRAQSSGDVLGFSRGKGTDGGAHHITSRDDDALPD